MPYGDVYDQQVRLLVRVIPLLETETAFALKGGTAINLFVRDMPRLSVDIDLTYLPVEDRATSLAAIDAALKRLATLIRDRVPDSRVAETVSNEESVQKLVVSTAEAQIKIEVTPVLRGAVFAPVQRPVSPLVEDRYGFAEVQMVSEADLYAGKIMAALDRQHPRDLFDIRDLLANEGVDDALRQAFLIYLISHGRPLAELLRPNPKDIAREFAEGFEGMTDAPVPLDELLAARDTLIREIVDAMPQGHRDFLIGFKRGEPDWEGIGLPDAADLPAVRWKQLNLDRLPPKRREALTDRLRAVWS
ncbi:nucleotidyl transferase AbiEii/AbiGii toxin family protein [Brevundimonas naejangsanensis]|uniref:nucleotidyl transferase AbiEii/AbiGii toxin family protein n=1 Tax=Brevundimonas naejangsanensis TaxID=588932 RepID=UPI0026F23219|nr:nucleotidyl transferase AbiEii/AbiGii toxin family protein [Brevundimonas naejangsanensis]